MNTPAKVLPANHAWKIDESLDLYQVEAWGKGYFSINAEGHVVVRPSMDTAREIDLYEVVQGLKARDSAHAARHSILRYSGAPPAPHRGCLRHGHRGERLQEPLCRGVPDQGQPAAPGGRGSVPLRKGIRLRAGVGSKPELLAVMSITENAPDRLVICNGFKDDSYIEAVILATKLGRTIIPVVEKLRRNPSHPEARGALCGTAEDRACE